MSANYHPHHDSFLSTSWWRMGRAPNVQIKVILVQENVPTL